MQKNRIKWIGSLLCLSLLLPAVGSTALAAERELIPLGQTTGIKMFSGGAMVVGFASDARLGGQSPAEKGGLCVGDVITAIDGNPVECNEQLAGYLEDLTADEVTLTIRRDDSEQDLHIYDLLPQDGNCRLGAWVRDSMAGIGTITFIDPQTGDFGALGHGICDIDTGMLMPFDNGSVMESEVISVSRGKAGSPGQLTGAFDLKQDNGVLFKNTEQGIFGKITDPNVYAGQKAYPIANKNEIVCGPIEIVSNVDGSRTERFDGHITKLLDAESGTKNFTIEITDPDLIEQTGGIVQGMSGSPILQNGKLIGAVTHVLINDSEKGYGIFIENMLDAAA